MIALDTLNPRCKLLEFPQMLGSSNDVFSGDPVLSNVPHLRSRDCVEAIDQADIKVSQALEHAEDIEPSSDAICRLSLFVGPILKGLALFTNFLEPLAVRARFFHPVNEGDG